MDNFSMDGTFLFGCSYLALAWIEDLIPTKDKSWFSKNKEIIIH